MRVIDVLLVEDNEADAKVLTRMLHRATNARFNVEHVEWLTTGLTAIKNRPFDIVLLDLTLPDPGAQGIDTLVTFMGEAGGVPVIVMTGYDDMETATNCVKYGAQDYLIKGEIHPSALVRSIVYAIERRHAEMVGKDLIRASLGTLVPSDDGATVALIQEHLRKFPGLIAELRQYIQKNAPGCAEDVEAILENYDIEVVLREVRDLVKERRGLQGGKTYIDQARESVREKTHSDLPPPTGDAKTRVLDAIQRLRGDRING